MSEQFRVGVVDIASPLCVCQQGMSSEWIKYCICVTVCVTEGSAPNADQSADADDSLTRDR